MERNMKIFLVLLLAVVFAVNFGLGSASADALHGFCYGTTPTCTDNGVVTPTDDTSPDFGFAISSGPQTGTYLVDILVANTIPNAASLSFSITGDLTGTSSLFNATAWTTGFLDTYLGLAASPNNPIGAFIPSTQLVVPGATGYFVYTFNLGTATLPPQNLAPFNPFLHVDGLPVGSLIVGFLNTTGGYVATANSGAIFITPEPATLLLLGSGLAGIGFWRMRKQR